MLETFFLVLRYVVTGLVLFTFSQLFQGKPVAPWLAWLASIVFLSLLSLPHSKKVDEGKPQKGT